MKVRSTDVQSNQFQNESHAKGRTWVKKEETSKSHISQATSITTVPGYRAQISKTNNFPIGGIIRDCQEFSDKDFLLIKYQFIKIEQLHQIIKNYCLNMLGAVQQKLTVLFCFSFTIFVSFKFYNFFSDCFTDWVCFDWTHFLLSLHLIWNFTFFSKYFGFIFTLPLQVSLSSLLRVLIFLNFILALLFCP